MGFYIQAASEVTSAASKKSHCHISACVAEVPLSGCHVAMETMEQSLSELSPQLVSMTTRVGGWLIAGCVTLWLTETKHCGRIM